MSFFAYTGKPSWCVPEGSHLSYLAHAHQDGAQALAALADSLGAPARSPVRIPLQLPELPNGPLTALGVAQVIAAMTSDNVIFADESATASFALLTTMARARPHTHLPLTGGSIGQGLPLGLCVNLRINGRDHLLPMAVEEPSVVAACSYASKLLRAGGGVTGPTLATPPSAYSRDRRVLVPASYCAIVP